MLADYVRHFRRLGRNARLYLISNTIQALTAGAIGVLYTLYLASLGYKENFIGLVLFAGVVGAGLAIPPAAPLVHRLGWRAMLLWSDWIGGVAIVLQLVVPVAPVILLTSVAAGASFAIVLIVNTPLLTAYSLPEDRTAVFGLGSALGLLAAVIGSLLGGFLPGFFRRAAVVHSGVLRALGPLLVHGQPARSYELALLVAGALALPSILPIYAMREDGQGRAASGPRQTAEKTPMATAPMTTSMTAPMAGAAERVRGWVRQARVLGRGVIGRFSVTQALLGFGAGLFIPYLGIYFVLHLHASTQYFGVLAAVLTIIQAGTALLSAPVADRFGKVRSSVLVTLISVPFLLSLGLLPTLALIAAAYLIRGSLLSMAGPPLQAFLMEAVPERTRVVASEAFNVTWQIAGALGVVVGGQLIHAAGYGVTFWVAAACYTTSAVLLTLWFGSGRRFRLSLPIAPEDAPPLTPPQRGEGEPGGIVPRSQ